MNLTLNDIILVVVLIIIYFCGALIFAKEDNNNPIVLPKEGVIRPEIEGYTIGGYGADRYSGSSYQDPKNYSERFLWNPDWLGQTNKDCYKLSKGDCMKYSNCGLCVRDGQAECIPGDNQGPLFKEGCQRWIHTDYRDRHIFGEKVLTISPPHDYRYPDYEAWYPSPQVRATL